MQTGRGESVMISSRSTSDLKQCDLKDRARSSLES